jgi:hypothetical protein
VKSEGIMVKLNGIWTPNDVSWKMDGNCLNIELGNKESEIDTCKLKLVTQSNSVTKLWKDLLPQLSTNMIWSRKMTTKLYNLILFRIIWSEIFYF